MTKLSFQRAVWQNNGSVSFRNCDLFVPIYMHTHLRNTALQFWIRRFQINIQVYIFMITSQIIKLALRNKKKKGSWREGKGRMLSYKWDRMWAYQIVHRLLVIPDLCVGARHLTLRVDTRHIKPAASKQGIHHINTVTLCIEWLDFIIQLCACVCACICVFAILCRPCCVDTASKGSTTSIQSHCALND